MQERRWPSWQSFRADALASFAATPLERREHWWFRGQSNTGHTLVPSIDRGRTFAHDADREAYIGRLLREFRSEAQLVSHAATLPEDEGFELLARHHGLPSPLLDFARSPWIAVFFAFAGSSGKPGDEVAVYAINKTKIPSSNLVPSATARPSLELVEDPAHVRFNRRALQQRGVFLRVSTASKPVEDLLGDGLSRWLLPAGERDLILTELDSMLLNATMLMYDLDGAARTAVQRLG